MVLTAFLYALMPAGFLLRAYLLAKHSHN